MHEKVHNEKIERKKDIVIERDIYIRSHALGLVGKSDVVEFHKSGARLLPFPVEYKIGKPKEDNTDKVQLCAQCICLEEMTGCNIPRGAIFYGKTRSRLNVEFDKELRAQTTKLAGEFHELIESGVTPKPEYSKKCSNCSFNEICLPEIFGRKSTVKQYLRDIVNEETV